MANTNGWTHERRARQAELIHSWQPWTKSTGARTPEGKAITSQNAALGKRNKQAAIEFLVDEKIVALADLAPAFQKLVKELV